MSTGSKKLTINLSFSSGGYGGIVSNDSNGRIITLPAASTNSVNRNIKPTKVTTASGMKILESGSLGDNITYMLYNDGSLFINGYGETYDFSGSPFNNPKNVREVIFENRDEKNNKVITSIGNNIFTYCTNLDVVYWSNYIKKIGDSAFNGCSNLKYFRYSGQNDKTTNFKFPNNLVSIGNYAFSGCKGLTSVTVSGTVKTIGQYAFSGCTSLKTAVIKNGVESIGFHTFQQCTALESLTLPYAGLSIENVKNNTYALSTNLFSYGVPEGTYSATGNGYNGVPKTLTSITITGGTRIPNSAFYGMSSLKTINLPNTITSIGDYASCGCIGLRNLYVDKTSKEWEKVNIGIFNDAIYVVNKTFNSISIKSQPKSVFANVNSTAEFTISVSGNKITYQWQYSKDNGKTWINCSNTSSKTNTLNLVAATNRNNYLYRCVIKDANGFTAVSKAATLTIKTKLEITKQPESVTAEINKTAEFKVQATGNNLKYQWQYSKDNGGYWINSSNPSSTTDTFNLVAAANRNNFLVRCVITDEYGETIESDSTILTIEK